MARESLANNTVWLTTALAVAAVATAVAGCAPLPASALRTGPDPGLLSSRAATMPAPAVEAAASPVVRAQGPVGNTYNAPTPGSAANHWRYGMAPSGSPAVQGPPPSTTVFQPGPNFAPPGGGQLPGPGMLGTPNFPEFAPPPGFIPPVIDPRTEAGIPIPLDVYVEEERTGRFMFGAAVNSDLGLTGQIIVDERNFDITRPPTSFQDILNGTAWRGAGQGFRMEAVPGSEVQRYTVSFTEPYLLDTDISMLLSGFYYDRRFYDWDEQRQGGRLGLGYRLTPDLSVGGAIRLEQVDIHDPRVITVPQLNAALGENDLYSGKVTLTHDTRDVPFAATEGHLIQLGYEQVFGDFDYPRGDFDYRRYFLVRERPDGSGRHTLAYSFRLGFSGAQTPIFDNYFAGGYSTMRGFDFRGASPRVHGVAVGGRFQFLGSVEYLFPLTADDMVKGALFVDYGTVEENIEIVSNNYRVAPGFGIRIAIPALGPAPLSFDFAFPVAKADFDDVENFSFFFGFGRN